MQCLCQGLVGKVELVLQIDVLPTHGRQTGNGIGQDLALSG
jgi:hypothetical protein